MPKPGAKYNEKPSWKGQYEGNDAFSAFNVFFFWDLFVIILHFTVLRDGDT